jgi:hypothetical protein
MSYLSNALKEYYTREGKRVAFRNKQSLNQLALTMWEMLGCQQIDASVLSRVLKGERLFTPLQLKVFCTLLEVSDKEEEYLLTCLQRDHNARLDTPVGATNVVPSSLARRLTEELTRGAFDMFYQGNYDEVLEKSELVQQLTNTYIGRDAKATNEVLGLNLYLKGRILANGELPTRVMGRLHPIFNELVRIRQTSDGGLLHGYTYILQSNAYYLAGGYSNAATKRKLYNSSISLAKKAVDTLPEDDRESLFALRLMAASAYYIDDQDTIRFLLKKAKDIILRQPKSNYVNALHLSMTLSKCMVASNMSNPFVMSELATNYFKRTLSGTGVYEVSSKKEEIDTLLLLRVDKRYIAGQLKEALQLADEHGLLRQKNYFNKLLRAM